MRSHEDLIGELYQATKYFNGRKQAEGFGFKSFQSDLVPDIDFQTDLQTILNQISNGSPDKRDYLIASETWLSTEKTSEGSHVQINRPVGSVITNGLEQLALKYSRIKKLASE